jgi:uncharacterized repeat protein (TIGR03843 family)
LPALELTPEQIAEVLTHGDLEVVGRMRYSSNATFLVEARADDVTIPAVYKPRRGERPLWDFPDGTLCNREVGAYELSAGLGWDIVPVTVLRPDGPLGAGAVQRFVDHDPEEHYFTLLDGNEDRFREFAVFDILANNTDRKGGHCLHDQVNDTIVGIDHGLTFHPHWKLRTVIWDFAAEPVPRALVDDVCRVVAELDDGPVGRRLSALLAPDELAAIGMRAVDLLREGRFPEPEPGYHAVPWPLV